MITTYEPDAKEWELDLKTRRKIVTRCMVCKTGEVQPGTTTLTVERGGMTLVIKAIPARVCSSCSEAYFDEATTKRIEAMVERLERNGVQVAVQDYTAA